MSLWISIVLDRLLTLAYANRSAIAKASRSALAGLAIRSGVRLPCSACVADRDAGSKPGDPSCHLGGKNSSMSPSVPEYFALILLRALASVGTASRQYLSSSQNRPWQSIP